MTEQAGDDTRETDAESTSEAADPTSADGDVGDRETEFVERVAAHDEELAEAVEERIGELQRRVETLEEELEEKSEEVDDLVSRLKRKQADFQNFKKRQEKKRDQLRERATEGLVERLLPVRDNLVRALEQGEEADIRPGVESTLEQFDDVLEEENVDVIDPEPGEEVDPQRHEVMLKVDSGAPEDTIAELYQPGYEMGEKVLRAAQVTVSNGAESEEEVDDSDADVVDADRENPDREHVDGSESRATDETEDTDVDRES